MSETRRPDYVRGVLGALREPVAYGSLVRVLLLKDIKARYQALGLGYVWSLLNPLLLMAVYSLVFSVILPVGTPAFPVFLASGLLPWLWFANSLAIGATSILSGGSLVRRIAFPTQVLPLVTVLSQLVQFVLSLPILFLFAVLYKIPVGATWLALPVVIAIQLPFTLGLALVFSAWTVRFRDLDFLLGNLLSMWFFLTPIIYPPDLLPESLRFLRVANPMALLVKSYQDAVYHQRWPDPANLGLALVFGIAMLGVGVWVFERRRWTFAEEI